MMDQALDQVGKNTRISKIPEDYRWGICETWPTSVRRFVEFQFDGGVGQKMNNIENTFSSYL